MARAQARQLPHFRHSVSTVVWGYGVHQSYSLLGAKKKAVGLKQGVATLEKPEGTVPRTLKVELPRPPANTSQKVACRLSGEHSWSAFLLTNTKLGFQLRWIKAAAIASKVDLP